MSTDKNKRVCPVEIAGGLDNSIRKFLHNPRKILKPYIKSGMTVLDMGCGPGVFSVEIAKLLNGSGKVIAADLQEGMLDKVRHKIQGTEFEKIIEPHKCSEEIIGIKEKADFVLAFYMVHEVPNQNKLLSEIVSILKPGGLILIVEPVFHVSKRSFNEMAEKLVNSGMIISDRPKIFFSRSILLKNKDI